MEEIDRSECLYSLLECHPSATAAEIRKSYQNLILKHHPDKNTTTSGNEKFHQIDRAWKVLRDPELRRQYDAEAGQQEYNDLPIVNETLTKEELEYEGDVFEKACRCGGSYSIDKEELEEMETSFYLNCSECSLVIEIVIRGG